jgi:hypothetical protein
MNDPDQKRSLVLRIGGHVLGPLGLVLVASGVLPSLSPLFLHVFSWAGDPLTRLGSILCGGPLLIAAVRMLSDSGRPRIADE